MLLREGTRRSSGGSQFGGNFFSLLRVVHHQPSSLVCPGWINNRQTCVGAPTIRGVFVARGGGACVPFRVCADSLEKSCCANSKGRTIYVPNLQICRFEILQHSFHFFGRLEGKKNTNRVSTRMQKSKIKKSRSFPTFPTLLPI